MAQVTLSEKGVVSMAGPDCETLLQDVLSCDVTGLPSGVARVGGLLTPQGKILFEFLLSRHGADGFYLELPKDQIESFIKRMTLYRLRAKVEITPVADLAVIARWDGEKADGDLLDERFREGPEVYRSYGEDASVENSMEDYARLRIARGVPEAGQDYDLADAFPHDVLMDLNGGVCLTKGCYVGQEVVSRMKHRGTARRRVVHVEADAPLPDTRAAIEAGGRSIGQLGTISGSQGLALVRIDRVAKAIDNRSPITAEGVRVRLQLPSWTGLQFPQSDAATKDAR